MRRLFGILILLLLVSAPVRAVEPDEMLKDPTLESRARTISAELRCLVCQNESIDESNADLARDLRRIVRERLQAGDSDQQVVDYIRARYGDFVLLKPPFEPLTWALWLAPPIILLLGSALAFRTFKRRVAEAAPLSEEERKGIEALR